MKTSAGVKHLNYRPQRSCGKVILLHLSVIPRADTPSPGQTPPCPVHARIHTPLAQYMLGYGQQAGSTHPTGMHYEFVQLFLTCYRPQRSWGKVMFLQASVILLMGGGGGVSAPVHAGIHPLSRHPPEQTCPLPPQADTPPEQTCPPRADTLPLPPSRHNPPGTRYTPQD